MKNPDEQLMTIFSAALDCGTNAARDVYLDKACSASPELRERVDALLRAHNRSVDFLREPRQEQAVTAAFKPASLPGGVNSSGRAFQEELRRLLRSRLILAHLLLLAYFMLLQLLS